MLLKHWIAGLTEKPAPARVRRRNKPQVSSVPQCVEKLEQRILLSGNPLLVADPAADPQPHVPDVAAGHGQYIVTLRPDVDVEAFASELRGRGSEVLQTYSHAIHGLAFRGNALRDDPRILSIEADVELHVLGHLTPNGKSDASVSTTADPASELRNSTGVDRIDAERNPYAKINGSTADGGVDLDIAIIDTGISQHSDLNVVGGINYAGGSSRNYSDGHGHGTHVAGTAAALDNGIGVVGVAPGARLWGVRVLNNQGTGSLSNIIKGVDWVTKNAATIEVANMSLGGTGQSSTLHTAIKNSVAAGVVYVVAAGNDGTNVYGADGTYGNSDDFFPAAYPEVMTISAFADADGQPGGLGGATSQSHPDNDDTHVWFSNYGEAVDLLLPGVDIYSTYNNGGYATMSGTSMASPHAAGLVALYIAEHNATKSASIGPRDYNRDSKVDASDVYYVHEQIKLRGLSQFDPNAVNPNVLNNDADRILENGTIQNGDSAVFEKFGWAGLGDLRDVAVASISAPSSVVAGHTVNVDVVVRNEGSTVETFTVGLKQGTTAIGEQTVTELAAGASAIVTFSWTVPSSDTNVHYSLNATAVLSGETPTHDKDNSRSKTINAGPLVRDGAITAITAPSSVQPGTTATVHVTLANQGNDTETFSVTLEESKDGTPYSVVPTDWSSITLAAGESRTLLVTRTWDALGSYSLTASVAPLDSSTVKSAETDLGDNSKSTTVTVANTLTFTASDVPAPIYKGYATQSYLTIDQNVTIADLNVYVDIEHSNLADVDVYLISPSGIKVALYWGGTTPGVLTTRTFDDEGDTPQQPLSGFDTQLTGGQWTLRVEDWGFSFWTTQTGTIKAWSLIVTPAPTTSGASITSTAPVQASGTDETPISVRRGATSTDWDGEPEPSQPIQLAPHHGSQVAVSAAQSPPGAKSDGARRQTRLALLGAAAEQSASRESTDIDSLFADSLAVDALLSA